MPTDRENHSISVDQLTKSYGARAAVDGLTFDVPTGVVCGFVGPNGAGKTTTIRMLLGLVRPTAGSGTLLGEPIDQPQRSLSAVGAMIEGPAFTPALSARDNLRVLTRLAGVADDVVDRVLDVVDLGARGQDKYRTFSLGMKQRLGIAAALAVEPRLIILDEPTNGLDPAGILEIRGLMRWLADQGVTVFVSSHLLAEIEAACDHLVIISTGRLRYAGDTHGLMAASQPRVMARPEAAQDVTRLCNLALTAGVSGRVIDGAIEVAGDASMAAWLNRAAMAEGIVLVQLTTERPTLEEVFFAMTDELTEVRS